MLQEILLESLFDKELHTNILRFGTMLSFAKSFSTNDKKWQRASIFTLVGFAVYHIFTKRFLRPTIPEEYKAAVNGALKVGTMLLVSNSLQGGNFDLDFATDSAFTLSGFAAYDLVISKLLKIEHTLLNKILQNILVIGTRDTIKQLLMRGNFDMDFVKNSLAVIAGFSMYDIIVSVECDK